MQNQTIIYYKDGQLDKFRTSKSLVRYYVSCYRNHQPIKRISFKSELY